MNLQDILVAGLVAVGITYLFWKGPTFKRKD